MGLPQIIIEFKKKAEKVIARSGNGVVALLLKEGDADDYVRLVNLGAPARIITETCTDYTEGLAKLQTKKWNYLAVPQIEETETQAVANWIKAQRSNRRTYKAVLPNCAANHEGIINFVTDEIVADEKTYSTAAYTARIAGLLAGLPLTRSSTYSVLPEITAIKESGDPGTDIDAGKLILINDGEKFKIGRGVNSLVTIAGEKTEDMHKIKIVEGMDIICDDIYSIFEEQYVGVANSYDNQVLFATAVNQYFKWLENQGVLARDFDNIAEIDNTESAKSFVNLAGNIKLQDAIEDLKFTIYV